MKWLTGDSKEVVAKPKRINPPQFILLLTAGLRALYLHESSAVAKAQAFKER